MECERKYNFCVGDKVNFEGEEYTITRATYKYLVIEQLGKRQLIIRKKSDFDKLRKVI